MKIIQINVEFGYMLPPLLDFLAREQPDIVCAQEVQSTSLPMPLEDSFRTLQDIKKRIGFGHCFFSPAWGSDVFGSKLEMGNAIFSNVPIHNQETIFISGEYTYPQVANNWIPNIRNLQICSVEVGGKKLCIANHHGFIVSNSATGGPETLHFTKKLAESLEQHNNSLIFCTDLNIIKESPGFAPVEGLGLRNLTAENGVKTTLSKVHRAPNKDSVACDYIFVSNNVKVKDFRVSDEVVSDHKALILEFEV